MSQQIATPVLHYGRAILVRLALACVVLRALLPVGFMADLPAAANGQFKVVICSAYGTKTVDFDLGLPPAHAPEGQTAQSDPCPFGMSPAAAPLPEPLAVAMRSAVTTEPVRGRSAHVSLPFSTGPPVGSRAPPAIHPIA
jgi:hypothetical protein